MKRGISILLCMAALVLLMSLCEKLLHGLWPWELQWRREPGVKETAAEMWSSFTDAPVVTDDGRCRAECVRTELTEGSSSMIRVNVYDNSTGALLDSFKPARATDFWGICWEEGTHNLWIQSADIGIHCYSEANGKWILNESAARPEGIVSKWD